MKSGVVLWTGGLLVSFWYVRTVRDPFIFFPFLVVPVFLNQDIFPHHAAVAESFSEISEEGYTNNSNLVQTECAVKS